jgi:hypothetical protein
VVSLRHHLAAASCAAVLVAAPVTARAQPPTLSIHDAMQLAGRYLGTAETARALADACQLAPPAVGQGKDGRVVQWRGTDDLAWLSTQATAYEALARAVVEKVEQTVPARAGEVQVAFDKEAQSQRLRHFRDFIAPQIHSPEELVGLCWGLKMAIVRGLPPKIMPEELAISPD